MSDDVKPAKATEWSSRTILACVALFAAGFVVGQGNTNVLPWQPEKDRPVLRFVARIAKFGLWLMVVQPPPPDNTYVARCEEGEICLNHREGW